MSKIKKWAEILTSTVGGWWTLMSGATSIPFALLALICGGKPGVWFAILAYVALWVMVIRMAYANYKLRDKTSTKRAFSIYFKALDDQIALLKLYRREGGKNIEKAARTFIEGADLCVEIGKFIEEKIGPNEATIFSAKSDCNEPFKTDDKSDFWESSIEFLTKKLIKLKEIMTNQQ